MRKRILPATTVLTIIAFVTFILWQYFGLLSEYNYFSANRDIKNGDIKFISFGLPMPSSKDNEITALRVKYGFKDSNIGCVVTRQDIKGIAIYNNAVEKYLTKRNGKNWNEIYLKEIDSLYKIAFIHSK